MKALALHATKNTTKPDATGAFIPEAIAFQKIYACHREGFDNTIAEPARRKAVEDAIRRYRDLEFVAVFSHGLRRSLQTGHTVSTVGALADAIAEATGPRVVVALYACSTGASRLVRGSKESVDDGFAWSLAHALNAHGKIGHVDAHTIAAHTTRNPYVRRFAIGAPFGEWLVQPGSPQWKAWRAALQGPMRFRFPTLTADQIRAELLAP